VIYALEDAQDYAAFEMAVTADYDAQSVVARELVLRLASLLWRLRRSTAIESGLFKIQAKHLLQFRQRQQIHQKHQTIIDSVCALATERDMQPDGDEPGSRVDTCSPSTVESADPSDDLTRAFQPYPLDRLSRHEATLWLNGGLITGDNPLWRMGRRGHRGPFRRRTVDLDQGSASPAQ
jgi:hypothetical protein